MAFNVHPVVVHFPFALLTFALLSELTARWRKDQAISRLSWWSQLWGTIGLAGAVATGLLAKSTTHMPAVANTLFSLHEEFAFVTSTTFAVLLLWRIPSAPALPKGSEKMFLVIFTFALGVLLAGAWFGGELVYGFGVGVSQPGIGR
jgi:uncharacterized membrane protein